MPADTLDQLAFDLFRTFARFEYALKASRFNRGDGIAQADFRAFALSVEACLENPRTPELKAAKAYLLERPPKRQVIQDGRLGWEDVARYKFRGRPYPSVCPQDKERFFTVASSMAVGLIGREAKCYSVTVWSFLCLVSERQTE